MSRGWERPKNCFAVPFPTPTVHLFIKRLKNSACCSFDNQRGDVDMFAGAVSITGPDLPEGHYLRRLV